MFKKNNNKILLLISLALSTFCLNISAMKNNENSANTNNIKRMNSTNKFSNIIRKEESEKFKLQPNANDKQNKSLSAPKLKNIQIEDINKKNYNSKHQEEFEQNLKNMNDKEKEKSLISIHFSLRNFINMFNSELETITKMYDKYKNLSENNNNTIRVYYDLCKDSSDLLNNIDEMNSLIDRMEDTYTKYIITIKNIDKNKLDEFNIKHNFTTGSSFNNSINHINDMMDQLFNAIKFPTEKEIEEIFRKNDSEKTDKDENKLKKYERKIDFLNLIKNLKDNKKLYNINFGERINEEIKIRREMVLQIKKVIQADLLENMEKEMFKQVRRMKKN